MSSYAQWFAEVQGTPPYPWQVEIGEDERCRNLSIRIPTGFGKTLGVLLAWIHHRVRTFRNVNMTGGDS